MRVLFFTLILLIVLQFNVSAYTTQDSTNYYDALYEENINWDWTDPNSYPEYFYISGEQPVLSVFPFTDANLGVIVEKDDYQPEDGWVLLYKDFGTQDFPVKMPYMVLYHEYTGMMRVYIFLVCPESYTRISIQTYFEMNGSANLAFAVSPASALDKKSEYENNAIIGYVQGSNGHWIYQDIPIAYEPEIGSLEHISFIFDTWGLRNTNIKIDGEIQLAQKKISNLGQNSKSIPQIIDGAGKSLSEKYKSWSKAQESTNNAFDEASTFFDDIGKSKISNGLSDLSSLVADLPFGPLGAIYGLYDFFSGGGKKIDPIPLYFEGEINLSGTMETELFIGKLKMRVPGSVAPTNDYWRPVYDAPLGVFNLSTTPTVQKLYYYQYYDDVNTGTMWTSYKFISDITYMLNPNLTNIQLEEIKANLFCSFTYPGQESYRYPEDLLQDWADDEYISLESGKTRMKVDNSQEAVLSYSSGFKQLDELNNLFINTPQKDIYLKFYIRLKRSDDSEAEPIVLTPTFKLDVENKEEEVRGPWSFYLKSSVNNGEINLKWAAPFADNLNDPYTRTLYVQKSNDGKNWTNIYNENNPGFNSTTYSYIPSCENSDIHFRVNLVDDYELNVYSQIIKEQNPNYSHVSISISGPSYLEYNNKGNFTANPSCGSGSYSNYRWWWKYDTKIDNPNPIGIDDPGPVIDNVPPGYNYWTPLPDYEGQRTISFGESSDFLLKCEVTDSYSNCNDDVHSVKVSGIKKNTQNNLSNLSDESLPNKVELTGNFPNPFNPFTTIKFGLPEDSPVKITIYSITGQKIITLADGSFSKGYHSIKWYGTNQSGDFVSNGIYIYELKAGKQKLIKKMVFAK
ncbi:MAG: T9SS type A sorting domain-containing protein [Caldithrix sp.]|nr:T9SS type A sorting domain-containing protein [Caldithrix sp.]